jgi:aspartyl-tRNA(Asn)/glutamyl-tRNA(Gln) amidotransferase subunit C
MSSVSTDTVKKVAKLSKLELQADEINAYAEQLSKILHHMDSLNEINVDGVEPMFHANVELKELRKDEVKVYDAEKILNSGINVNEHYFSVPNIISKD